MINVQTLKEIITSNDEFILREVKHPVKRSGFILPESSKKVVVFYGVRRSGKTFIFSMHCSTKAFPLPLLSPFTPEYVDI